MYTQTLNIIKRAQIESNCAVDSAKQTIEHPVFFTINMEGILTRNNSYSLDIAKRNLLAVNMAIQTIEYKYKDSTGNDDIYLVKLIINDLITKQAFFENNIETIIYKN